MLTDKEIQKLRECINIIDDYRLDIPDQDINNITYEKDKYIQSCYDCVDYLNIVIEGY